ncbi:hypothetical protein [Hydrogenophaga aquatica]
MKHIVLALGVLVSAPLALAHGCPAEMAAIDAKLATQPTLDEATLTRVKQLRAGGEAAHNSGAHDDSMKLLGEAKKLLGI